MFSIQKNIPIPLPLAIPETINSMQVGDSVSLVHDDIPTYHMHRRVRNVTRKITDRKFIIGSADITGIGYDHRCWRIS